MSAAVDSEGGGVAELVPVWAMYSVQLSTLYPPFLVSLDIESRAFAPWQVHVGLG